MQSVCLSPGEWDVQSEGVVREHVLDFGGEPGLAAATAGRVRDELRKRDSPFQEFFARHRLGHQVQCYTNIANNDNRLAE